MVKCLIVTKLLISSKIHFSFITVTMKDLLRQCCILLIYKVTFSLCFFSTVHL